jgi:hypothetical protein
MLLRGVKQQVGTVSLELKRADSTRSKCPLAVYSNDKQHEKKDKSVNEPPQFLSGKDPLFEIVVNNVSAKNTVTGYLSSPKGAPRPVVAAGLQATNSRRFDTSLSETGSFRAFASTAVIESHPPMGSQKRAVELRTASKQA